MGRIVVASLNGSGRRKCQYREFAGFAGFASFFNNSSIKFESIRSAARGLERIPLPTALKKDVNTYCAVLGICYIPRSVFPWGTRRLITINRQLFFVWLDNVFAFVSRLMTTGS